MIKPKTDFENRIINNRVSYSLGFDAGVAYERERAEKLVENIRLKINKHAEAYGTDIFPDYNLSDTPKPSIDQVSGKMGRHMIQCFHLYLDEALAEYKGEVE